MRASVIAAMVIVACGAVGRSARAQGIAPGVRPEQPPAWPAPDLGQNAQQMLRDAQAAAERLKSVSYKARASAVLDGSFPAVDADVLLARLDRGGGSLGAKVRIRGEIESPEGKKKFAACYDGETLRIIDHAAKKVIEATGDGAVEALDEFLRTPRGAAVFYAPFMQGDAFEKEIEAESAMFAGTEDVEGVACNVVRAEGVGGVLSVRISLGTEDRLARRVEVSAKAGDRGGAPVTVRLRDLKADPALEKNAFSIPIPSGYTVEERKGGAGGAGGAGDAKGGASLRVGDEAPDWTLRDREGNAITLSELRGTIVVLDFWATWCGPCKKAMPAMQELHDRFAGRGVLVYGADVWEKGPANPGKYMDDHDLTYGLLLGGDDVAKNYGVRTIPALFVIGADGRVLYTAFGLRDGEEKVIARLIEKNLSERSK